MESVKADINRIEHIVNTQDDEGKESDSSYNSLIRQTVIKTLRNEAVDKLCVVNVLITNDDGIRMYNRKYRDTDKATDVLSFPMQEFLQAGWSDGNDLEIDKDTGEFPLGDIIISFETVMRQAVEYENTLEHETAYLIIHSTLHLLGYDHNTEDNERVMNDKCKTIIQWMGTDKNGI